MGTEPASRAGVAPRRVPLLPNGVFGMLVFVAAEAMLFSGLLSAFVIAKSGSLMTGWPPAGQPRLPAGDTLVHTAALLLSGLALLLANRAFGRGSRAARHLLLAALLLGVAFVGLQGAEWWVLLGQGLTLTSSQAGGFFYLIVGVHGAHAVAALVLLARAYVLLLRDRLGRERFWTAQVFWYFVVVVWPVLYHQLYL